MGVTAHRLAGLAMAGSSAADGSGDVQLSGRLDVVGSREAEMMAARAVAGRVRDLFPDVSAALVIDNAAGMVVARDGLIVYMRHQSPVADRIAFTKAHHLSRAASSGGELRSEPPVLAARRGGRYRPRIFEAATEDVAYPTIHEYLAKLRGEA